MEAVTIAEIKQILCDVHNRTHDRALRPRDIEDDDLLYDLEGTGATAHLDFDSLDGLEVTAFLEDRYGVIAPSEIDPRDLSTPRSITDFVARLIRERTSVEG